jgi:hypothetical protein
LHLSGHQYQQSGDRLVDKLSIVMEVCRRYEVLQQVRRRMFRYRMNGFHHFLARALAYALPGWEGSEQTLR